MIGTYIVALEADIHPASLSRSRLGEMDLLIWRGASGNIHVWEDRCPHRSIRLSAGRNMGRYVEGIYHGWQFGEDGTVLSIPAEGGKAFPDIQVNAVTSTVASGFVWATMDDQLIVDEGFSGKIGRAVHFSVPIELVTPHLAFAQSRATPWGQGCMVYSIKQDARDRYYEAMALRGQLEGAQ